MTGEDSFDVYELFSLAAFSLRYPQVLILFAIDMVDHAAISYGVHLARHTFAWRRICIVCIIPLLIVAGYGFLVSRRQILR